MNRRKFLKGIGCVAVAAPFAAEVTEGFIGVDTTSQFDTTAVAAYQSWQDEMFQVWKTYILKAEKDLMIYGHAEIKIPPVEWRVV